MTPEALAALFPRLDPALLLLVARLMRRAPSAEVLLLLHDALIECAELTELDDPALGQQLRVLAQGVAAAVTEAGDD